MSNVPVDIPYGGTPVTMISSSGAGTDITRSFTNTNPDSLLIIQGIDVVMTSGPDALLSARASLLDGGFFWGDTSAGSVGGVKYFSYRGAVPLLESNTVTVEFQAVSAATVGIFVWGLFFPWSPVVL